MVADPAWLTGLRETVSEIFPSSGGLLLFYNFSSMIPYLVAYWIICKLRRADFPQSQLVPILLSGASLPTLVMLICSPINPALLTMIEDSSIYLAIVGIVAVFYLPSEPFRLPVGPSSERNASRRSDRPPAGSKEEEGPSR